MTFLDSFSSNHSFLKYILAHLSQRLKWAIVIAHRPSVYGPVYYIETLCRLKLLSWQFRLHYLCFSEEFAVLRRY